MDRSNKLAVDFIYTFEKEKKTEIEKKSDVVNMNKSFPFRNNAKQKSIFPSDAERTVQ